MREHILKMIISGIPCDEESIQEELDALSDLLSEITEEPLEIDEAVALVSCLPEEDIGGMYASMIGSMVERSSPEVREAVLRMNKKSHLVSQEIKFNNCMYTDIVYRMDCGSVYDGSRYFDGAHTAQWVLGIPEGKLSSPDLRFLLTFIWSSPGDMEEDIRDPSLRIEVANHLVPLLQLNYSIRPQQWFDNYENRTVTAWTTSEKVASDQGCDVQGSPAQDPNDEIIELIEDAINFSQYSWRIPVALECSGDLKRVEHRTVHFGTCFVRRNPIMLGEISVSLGENNLFTLTVTPRPEEAPVEVYEDITASQMAKILAENLGIAG